MCVQMAAWGILHTGDAGTVSKSAQGLATMMTIIVDVLEPVGLTMSEKKAEVMLLRTPNHSPRTLPLPMEAAGQRCRQAMPFLYLPVGGLIFKQRRFI